MPEMTVKTRKNFTKMSIVTMEEFQGDVCFWQTDPFAKDLTVGAKGTGHLTKKPNYKDPMKEATWLDKWNGVEAGQQKAKGGYSGGGGGQKWQPKPEHENLAIMAQSALGKAVEAHAPSALGKDLKASEIVATADAFMDWMVAACAKHRGKLA
jgi:hypothetical protein